jgi:hypothetical protein
LLLVDVFRVCFFRFWEPINRIGNIPGSLGALCAPVNVSQFILNAQSKVSALCAHINSLSVSMLSNIISNCYISVLAVKLKFYAKAMLEDIKSTEIFKPIGVDTIILNAFALNNPPLPTLHKKISIIFGLLFKRLY